MRSRGAKADLNLRHAAKAHTHTHSLSLYPSCRSWKRFNSIPRRLRAGRRPSLPPSLPTHLAAPSPTVTVIRRPCARGKGTLESPKRSEDPRTDVTASFALLPGPVWRRCRSVIASMAVYHLEMSRMVGGWVGGWSGRRVRSD